MSAWITRPAQAADMPALQAVRAARGLPALSAPTPDDQGQWLVAHGRHSGQIGAAVRLRARIGLVLPRFWYHVGASVHAAPELQLFHRQRTLLLGNDHTGASELADLVWRCDGLPLDAQAGALRSLVQVALALAQAAAQRGTAGSQLIIELPGVRDAAGQSPFWHGLGRHFYSGNPQEAEGLHGADWPGHVAALLPRHPVLAGFLPDAAQAAIAQVEPHALVLREVLAACGMRYSHHICIHDGGPVLVADLDGDVGQR